MTYTIPQFQDTMNVAQTSTSETFRLTYNSSLNVPHNKINNHYQQNDNNSKKIKLSVLRNINKAIRAAINTNPQRCNKKFRCPELIRSPTLQNDEPSSDSPESKTDVAIERAIGPKKQNINRQMITERSVAITVSLPNHRLF